MLDRGRAYDAGISGCPDPFHEPVTPSPIEESAFGADRNELVPDLFIDSREQAPIHGAEQEGPWTIFIVDWPKIGERVYGSDPRIQNQALPQRRVEVVPASQLEELRTELDAERKRAESATTWLGRVLALDHPPRNEPGIDEAVKQQAREALGRLRDGD